MQPTWEQVDSELTRCLQCNATFCIGNGDPPCSCSPLAASVVAQGVHASSSRDGSATDAAADDFAEQIAKLGDTVYWRKKIREFDGKFKALRRQARDVDVDDRWFGANRIAKLKLELECLDRQRKNAWNGYQASLPDKSDADLAVKKKLVERAEAVERRSRGH